jgi:hypothetical protein
MDIEFLKKHYEYDPETGDIKKKTAGKRWKIGHRMGWKSAGGYMSANIFGKYTYLHIVAYAMHHGVWPTSNIDHINRIRDDNRAVNLRLADDSQNGANQSLRIDNTSGKKGVTWSKRRGKWQAQIQFRGKRRCAWFDSVDQAASFYDQAASEMQSEFFLTNRMLENEK